MSFLKSVPATAYARQSHLLYVMGFAQCENIIHRRSQIVHTLLLIVVVPLRRIDMDNLLAQHVITSIAHSN